MQIVTGLATDFVKKGVIIYAVYLNADQLLLQPGRRSSLHVEAGKVCGQTSAIASAFLMAVL